MRVGEAAVGSRVGAELDRERGETGSSKERGERRERTAGGVLARWLTSLYSDLLDDFGVAFSARASAASFCASAMATWTVSRKCSLLAKCNGEANR